MEIHNVCIYHCLHCGRVVHAELDDEPPKCCGHTMTRACEETVAKDENGEESAERWPEPDWPTTDADD